MRNCLLMTATALALVGAAPTVARAQNMQQLLQGLTTGNQTQDKALQEAYERGYQKGRQDEAQLARRSGQSNGGSLGGRPDDRNYNTRNQDPYNQGSSGYRR